MRKKNERERKRGRETQYIKAEKYEGKKEKPCRKAEKVRYLREREIEM